MYGLTRLFITSLPEDQAYIYIKEILVPACVRDIKRNQKLNIHLFNSLIKAKYKVYAFFRGVVFFAIEQNQSSNFLKAVNAVIQKCSFPKNAVTSAMIQILKFPPS